eukprot:TRINITY_DN1619_c0_g1_i1.p1 TRINITY_DN1619_c0_g1~~TRINITY_DN1619_c0_g1_i1.p1  ORF type:complete len:413 (-),score=155.66 TRINITY_DN1619_c0_g1_i1:141-1343(-)
MVFGLHLFALPFILYMIYFFGTDIDTKLLEQSLITLSQKNKFLKTIHDFFFSEQIPDICEEIVNEYKRHPMFDDVRWNFEAKFENRANFNQVKIGYLILTHDVDTVFSTIILLESIYNSQDYFMIHLDSKASPCLASLLKDYASRGRYKNVFVVQEFSLFWGKWAMVQAEISCLKRLLSYRWDITVLLSGDSFPLVPQIEIHRRLSKAKLLGSNFVTTNGKPPQHFREMSYYKKQRVRPATCQDFSCNRLTATPNGGAVYYGSQWFILHRDFVHWLFRDYSGISTLTSWVNFFSRIETGSNTHPVQDECFFPTVIMNSPYRSSIFTRYYVCRWENWGRCGIYIDGKHKPPSSPCYIAPSDVSSLEWSAKECTFGRKIAPLNSREVNRLINQRIYGLYSYD